MRPPDNLVVGGGRARPVPCVLEGLDLGSAGGACLFAEEDVVGAVGVERWVQVYQVDGVVRDVVAEDVQVIAVVEDVRLHVHCGEILARMAGRGARPCAPTWAAARVPSPAAATSAATPRSWPRSPGWSARSTCGRGARRGGAAGRSGAPETSD